MPTLIVSLFLLSPVIAAEYGDGPSMEIRDLGPTTTGLPTYANLRPIPKPDPFADRDQGSRLQIIELTAQKDELAAKLERSETAYTQLADRNATVEHELFQANYFLKETREELAAAQKAAKEAERETEAAIFEKQVCGALAVTIALGFFVLLFQYRRANRLLKEWKPDQEV